ncbi:MAG: hypothetical protein CVU43_17005 [Chloroflexi bacterium HGW-Chloroflexi-5]|jgi:hypothetical protein|nr:MAG: hypothetical protein CVU43_17005 [Chloroflexi bacterium HGW-Chloroflexi-5]
MADVVKVVDTGLAKITDLLAAVTIVCPGWVGWGTGTTAPVVGNTGLETPSAEARTVGTKTQQTTTTTSDTYQVVALITAASAQAITEVGVFDALTSGNLFLRATFSAINVSIGDTITFTIKTVFDNP